MSVRLASQPASPTAINAAIGGLMRPFARALLSFLPAAGSIPDWAYASRRLVENLWAWLKEWRAVATRYQQTARAFLGVLCLAAALIGSSANGPRYYSCFLRRDRMCATRSAAWCRLAGRTSRAAAPAKARERAPDLRDGMRRQRVAGLPPQRPR